MCIHPLRALDLRGIVQQVEAATGIRSGFTTDNDHAHFRHVVELAGLCRATLGHDRFCAAYRIAMDTAARVAPMDFIVVAIRDHRRVRTGYEFGFAAVDTAVAFRDAAMAALGARGVV